MQYIKNGKQVFFLNGASAQLEPLVYRLSFSMDQGYFLTEDAAFKQPDKLYGDVQTNVDRILYRFNNQEKNVGVYLKGEKGSGKTLLSQTLAVQSKLPTLIIGEGYKGDGFVKAVSSLPSMVVLFDEFDKHYEDERDQKYLLGLLESVQKEKKLFIFTSNASKESEFLINRPSRIFYYKEFKGLTIEEIEELGKDKLTNQNWYDEYLEVVSTINKPNFDVVNSLINESNLFKITPMQAVKLMNIEKSDIYDVEVTIDSKYQKKGKAENSYTETIKFSNLKTEKALNRIEVKLGKDSIKNMLFTEELYEKYKFNDILSLNTKRYVPYYKSENSQVLNSEMLGINERDLTIKLTVTITKLT